MLLKLTIHHATCLTLLRNHLISLYSSVLDPQLSDLDVPHQAAVSRLMAKVCFSVSARLEGLPLEEAWGGEGEDEEEGGQAREAWQLADRLAATCQLHQLLLCTPVLNG